MLASEINSIFQDILRDYKSVEIESLIQQTSQALVARGNNNYYSIRQGVIDSIEVAKGKLNERLDSTVVARFFEDSVYPRVLPRVVLSRLVSLLAPTPDLAGDSSESQLIRAQVSAATTDFQSFVSVATKFKQSDFVLPTERILFSLRIPEQVIKSDFSIFYKKIELYERFFRLCADYALSSNRGVEIKHASMSDLLMHFEAAKEYMAVLLPIWSHILEFTIETVKAKAAFATLLNSGLSQDQIDKMKDVLEANSLKVMTENIAKIADAATKDPNRQTEIKGHFEQTCRLVSNDVAGGSVLDLETKADLTVSLLGTTKPNLDAEAGHRLLAENKKLQAQIDALRKMEIPVLLQSVAEDDK